MFGAEAEAWTHAVLFDFDDKMPPHWRLDRMVSWPE